MHGNRSVLLRKIDASCRTVNLLCFSSCRTQNFQIAVLPETRVFENDSVKSLSLQMKLIPKVILNMLNVLTLKKEQENALNNAETIMFSRRHVVLKRTSSQDSKSF